MTCPEECELHVDRVTGLEPRLQREDRRERDTKPARALERIFFCAHGCNRPSEAVRSPRGTADLYDY